VTAPRILRASLLTAPLITRGLLRAKRLRARAARALPTATHFRAARASLAPGSISGPSRQMTHTLVDACEPAAFFDSDRGDSLSDYMTTRQPTNVGSLYVTCEGRCRLRFLRNGDFAFERALTRW